MWIATLSYCKREIISLQRVNSAAKSNVSRKTVFILEVLRTLTLPLLTDSLQSVSVIKRMQLKSMKMTFFPVNWILLFKHSWILKNLTGYAWMARLAVPRLSWALPKSEFGEHISNNNPSLKQLVKKRKKWLYRLFLAAASQLLSSFLMSAFHSFLKCLYATDKGKQC